MVLVPVEPFVIWVAFVLYFVFVYQPLKEYPGTLGFLNFIVLEVIVYEVGFGFVAPAGSPA